MMNLSAEYLKKIDEIVEEHKDKKGPVKLMLHDVQKQLGYIPFEAMEKISQAAQVPVGEVYGVVSFYTQFTTEPKGKHVVNVCLGTACYVRGSQLLLDRIKILTNAPVNGTSPDNLFSLDATRCLGACGLAPVGVLDEQVFGNANINKDLENAIKRIIKEEKSVKS
ncbi:MAG: NADH-quinone oxidoreductase subunit E [Erysipelotrichaceae bacterium]|nr:MAG: NADH-quinone oxidoreductase subunit [Erysipelotrichaceae bacterium]TXT19268.1 MAG: NADH-quinone oxidoreductase subunit E [Erysipelotrichaceae bacterium]